MSSRKLSKRLLSCALALFGVLLVATSPVNAQAQSSSSILDELEAMRVDVVDVDLILNDITHELYEVQVQVNEARSQINQGGSERLVQQAIEDAQEFLGLILSGKFAEFEGILNHLNTEVNGPLISKITTLLEDLGGELTPRDVAVMTKLKLKAESIELFTGAIMNEVEALKDRLDNGGEDACDTKASAPDVASCLDAAETVVVGAEDQAALNDALVPLNFAYTNLTRAIREANRIVRKKKLIVMRMNTLVALCSRVDACANFTLGGGAASIKVVPAGIVANGSAQVEVYNLKGQRVVGQTAANALESVKAQLANGVYLAVVRHFDANGKFINQEVQRLVIVR